jgi:hypothetical protein
MDTTDPMDPTTPRDPTDLPLPTAQKFAATHSLTGKPPESKSASDPSVQHASAPSSPQEEDSSEEPGDDPSTAPQQSKPHFATRRPQQGHTREPRPIPAPVLRGLAPEPNDAPSPASRSLQSREPAEPSKPTGPLTDHLEHEVFSVSPQSGSTRRTNSTSTASRPLGKQYHAQARGTPSDPTTVHITIGTLEVRAIPTPGQPTVPAQKPKSPQLGLDAYLRQRRDRGRG